MQTTSSNSNSGSLPFTYSLLVRSEEKSRSVLETAVYTLCILSSVFSIWQAAQQPITLPSTIATPTVASVQRATVQRS
jgi:hypothetical protein